MWFKLKCKVPFNWIICSKINSLTSSVNDVFIYNINMLILYVFVFFILLKSGYVPNNNSLNTRGIHAYKCWFKRYILNEIKKSQVK